MACEFVSPKFKGVDGMRQLIADIQTIKSLGARVNSSCGLHIHVGFNRADAGAMKKLTAIVANFEKAIFAATGTKNRERGQWCSGIQRHGSVDRAIQSASHHRYHIVNLGSEYPTVEFRAFSASLNPVKIVPYVRMCVAAVEKALCTKRETKWVAKPVKESSPIHRKGDGQTALTRFFYFLGWTKGRQSHVFGDLTGDGIPTMKRSKRELMRLARKYDAQS
jgi:hypothetical protein